MRARFALSVALSVAVLSPAAALATPTSHARPPHATTTTVVPGVVVSVQHWRAAGGGSERSSLMTVDLTNKHLSMNAYSAYQVTNGPYLPVRDMISRSGAIGGINADFFDLGTYSGQTTGGIVRSGAIWKTPRPGFNANFYLRSDGTAGIGPVAVSGFVRYSRSVHYSLTSVNSIDDAVAGRLTLITPVMAGTELPSRCAVATLSELPKGGARVTRLNTRTRRHASLPQLSSTSRALVGCGAAATWLRGSLPVGRVVTLSVGFVGTRIAALVDGAQVLVKDGKGYRDPRAHVIQDRHAETFACVSRDSRHLLLGTVDMRYWTSEAGVTMNQLRSYLLGKKCWSAMAFDGGGSATLDYRLRSSTSVVTVNHPADGQERRIPDALLLYYRR